MPLPCSLQCFFSVPPSLLCKAWGPPICDFSGPTNRFFWGWRGTWVSHRNLSQDVPVWAVPLLTGKPANAVWSFSHQDFASCHSLPPPRFFFLQQSPKTWWISSRVELPKSVTALPNLKNKNKKQEQNKIWAALEALFNPNIYYNRNTNQLSNNKQSIQIHPLPSISIPIDKFTLDAAAAS